MPARRIDVDRLRAVSDGTRTLAEVAQLCGASEATTGKWVRRLDLPRRAPGNPVAGRVGDQCRICASHVEIDTDKLGRLVFHCPGCERRRAGRCMDCNRRTDGRAWRCEACRDRRRHAQGRQCDSRRRERRSEQDKLRLRKATPEQRAHRKAVKKAWRDRNKLRITLGYRRRQRLARRGGFATRERYLAYQKAYNDKRAAQKRAYMHERAKFAKSAPTCRTCGEVVPWSGTGRPPLDCARHTRNPKVRARQQAAA